MIGKRRGPDDEGFTLIELLVVVVIIGVLIAIAIPLYNNYKKGAQNASAESDVKNAIVAIQSYYTANGSYPGSATSASEGSNISLTSSGVASSASASASSDTITVSDGNKLQLTNNTTYYVVCGQNTSGGTIYTYNSNTSKSVAKSSATSLAACASATS
jgi:type IV pilus assembly protein PilA